MRTLSIAVSFVAIFTMVATPALAAGTGIWEKTRCAADSVTGGPTTACDLCDALQVAANIVNFLLQFATIGAVIMIVVGAFIMMFSAGSEERFATGKKAIQNAVVGLAIALAAWLIVSEVLHFLSGNVDVPWNQISCT